MGLQIAFLVEGLPATLERTLEVRLILVFLDVRCHITYLVICLVAAFHWTVDLRLVSLLMGL